MKNICINSEVRAKYKNKIWILVMTICLMTTMFCGCGARGNLARGESDNGKLNVVATIFPQYDFVRQIAGDKVNLTMLLKPGTESHSYEPSPQDIIDIKNCDVFIYVGGESDDWISGVLDSINTSKMKIISLMDLVEKREEEISDGMDVKGHDEHDDSVAHEDTSESEGMTEHEEEYDEHVWTDPNNAILISEEIDNVLEELDKDNADEYKTNTEAYVRELKKLDTEFQDVVENGKRRTFVFGDRFPLLYFAKTYGLDYYAAFPGCSSATEASAQTVAFLIDKVKSENIPVVFHIEMSNENMCDTICSESGSEKLLFYSCHNITVDNFEEGETYLSLMKKNVVSLRKALG